MTTATTRLALNPSQIEQHLARRAGWRWDKSAACVEKSWTFDSFRNLMTCLTQITELAEQLDHHPHITTCYTHLQIRLSTHDAQGLTDLDFQLAEAIDTLIDRHFITT
jgi:4a-hydroxytetrahydrobiopterin dehydratase